MAWIKRAPSNRPLHEWEGDLDREREEQIEQATRAVNPEHFVRWPWTRLARLTGPLQPGHVTVCAAATGQGKTTFLISVAAELAAAGHRVWYVPLERPASEMLRIWAAWSLRLDVQQVLEYDLPEVDLARVNAWLAKQRDLDRGRLGFSQLQVLDVGGVQQIFAEVIDSESGVLMIDHLNHAVGGYDEFQQINLAILNETKALIECGVTTICAAQIKRDQTQRDPLDEFHPPRLSHVQGGGLVAQYATRVFGLWRPLREDISDDERRLARVGQGGVQISDLLQRQTIGVRVMKDRIGGRIGQLTRLGLMGGRIVDEPPSDRVAPLDRGDAYEREGE